jgi:hypothetical protein
MGMTRTRRQAAIVMAAMACALVATSTAQAIIQVQRGISGVTLGMTPASAKAALGIPNKTKKGHDAFGPFTEYQYAGGITVGFQGNANVTAVDITGQSDRTATGVGVGSTEQQVKKGVRGVKCDTVAGIRSCHVGALLAGRRVTDFLLRHGRVSRVTVGFVID